MEWIYEVHIPLAKLLINIICDVYHSGFQLRISPNFTFTVSKSNLLVWNFNQDLNPVLYKALFPDTDDA